MELLEKYKEYKKQMAYYSYAIFVISFDNVTDCPLKDRERSDEVCNYYEEKYLEIEESEDYKNTIEGLYQIRDTLDEVTKLDIELEHKAQVKLSKIPHEELIKQIQISSEASRNWLEATRTLDYSKFLKSLDKLVDFNKKYIVWQETDKIKGFNVLLDDMEEGYTEEMYDEFFDVIEKELVPYVKDILSRPQKYNPKLDTLLFDVEKQKKLTEFIMNKMEYNKEVGCVRETTHPFTNWANHNDVRITTNYHEDLLFSNIYSVMHEVGHALFQIHMDSKYDDTNVFNNVSCITHESQSRFYENYLGRRRSYVKFLYPVLKEYFPKELEDITEDDIYYYVNACKAQYYRVEADELTYPLHVLIRYKVEKALFHNEITPEQMPELFDKLMYEYLGIKPHNLKEGCFQDSHWSSGFGYFPTYAVGSAYGAMFLEEIMKDIDIDKDLSEGNFHNINIWLTEKIHKYSGTRNNNAVIKAVCNKDFDPHVYIKYLKDKYDDIYK